MGQDVSRERCCTAGRPQSSGYGWQRKCLFMVLLGLLLVVFLNFAATLWLIQLLDLNVAGFEGLNFLSEELQLPGHVFVLGSIISSVIYSSIDPVTIESSHNFTMETRDHQGHVTNSLFFDEHKLQSHASVFGISDSRGRNLFSADRHEVVIGSQSLRLSGVGGSVFDRSVQTNEVVSGIGTDLRLESPNRRLQINGPSGVTIESIAGDINVLTQEDIKLESIDGGIRIEASGVYLPGLRSAHPSTLHNKHRSSAKIYQLCVCNNGQLFLAPSDGHCATSRESTAYR